MLKVKKKNSDNYYLCAPDIAQSLLKTSGAFRIIIIIGVIGLVFFSARGISAQVSGGAVAARRAQLQAELDQLEKDIDAQQQILQVKQRESVSLERDIAIIDAKIKKAKLSIRARNLTISGLGDDILEKNGVISSLTEKMRREKESVAQLMRKTNEVDAYSFIEIILANQNLSDLFFDVDSYEALNQSLTASLAEVKSVKENTEKVKSTLESKREEEVELKQIQVLEQRKLEGDENKKQQILKQTKGQEQAYQDLIKSKEKDATAIRTELFSLRGSAAIPFEKALDYANFAFQKTGVRPAFLLGIITEESNLGENLGSGNWKDDLYDCYKSIGYPKSAEKQKKAFLSITSALGFDPDAMPVSKAPYYGCGGAMGPAQFMPTTWAGYTDLIASITGHNPPNPWDPQDAFIASALLLKDGGAAKGGYTAERRAALRYLAGGNWQKPAYAFYGDDVMDIAVKYQHQIDILQGQ